ncbi:hypothetical protein LNKW23_29880 [Paralimibaculum aggregatum]|uniref:N-acetyltransferase domain-containing protein n=1 Tax=Paralimibaculum aggregatum TaxID=3036245 RepID=A0ABQ6LR89_9RHOB|nr:GNAT family N-acetyltransferase [Limibaculum sp. NKW23]GMG83774.1 hypothetical protein LNKW23_29880 [Limibaculum sp. NKW23]
MEAGQGTPAEVIVTYLEMTARPAEPPRPLPVGQRLALVAAEAPPVHWFLYLYRAVGADWHWTDWLERPEAELAGFVRDPRVTIHTLLTDGWPGGFFMLDTREAGVCDLAYFGLVPEAIGRGLGNWLLDTAVRSAWDRPGVERVTVNTCTLDHPRALGLYQRAGFVPVRRETVTRQLGG